MTLVRRAWSDLREHGWHVIGLALLVAIVTLLVLGGFRAQRLLAASRDGWSERLQLADLEIRCHPAERGLAVLAREIPGVAAAAERLILLGTCEITGRHPMTALLQIRSDASLESVNQWRVLAGRYPRAGERAALVDRSVAEVHGVQVGDRITVRFEEHERTLPVVGITLSPEFMIFPIHPDYDMPLRSAVAVVGVSAAAVDDIARAREVNSVLVRLSPGADIDEVRAALQSRLPVSVLEALPRDERPGRRITTMIITDFDLYMPTVSLSLLVIALLLLIVVLARIVHRRRRQLGILLALGHTPSRIALSFLPLALAPVLLGTLLGGLLHGPFARNIYDGFVSGIGFPPLLDPGIGAEVLATFAVSLLVALAACLVPALALVRRRPAELLQPGRSSTASPAPSCVRRAMLRVGSAIRLPFPMQLGLSHVARRLPTTGAALLGSGGILCIVTAFILVHVTHRVELSAFLDRLGLDATVYFDGPVDDAVIADAAHRAKGRAEALINSHAIFQLPRGASSVRVICAPPGAWLDKLRIARGRGLGTADSAEVLIDHCLADREGLDVGTRLTVFSGLDSPEGVDVTVVGVLDGFSFGLAVLPLETGRTLFLLPELATGARVASALPAQELEDALWEMPRADGVFSLERASREVEDNFRGGMVIWTWALLLSAAVSVLFLCVLGVLDARDHARELAVLRAVGWSDGRLLAVCLVEVMVRGLLALGLAIVLAVPLASFFLARMSEANRYHMALQTPVWVFAAVCAVALVFLPLGALPAWRAARRVTPARAIRVLSVE